MDAGFNAILIAPEDNVATVTAEILPGETVRFSRRGETVQIVSGGVPIYHKVALADISAGQVITKYGEVIGVAIRDIPAGSHVHNHNLASGVQ